MAQLAIKGHATRGNEVIEILEMFGGKNETHIKSTVKNTLYYINEDSKMYLADKHSDMSSFVIYTLEEFIEKFPYKVGDRVYNIIHNENQTITNLVLDVQENEVVYQTNNNEYVYVNYLQPYKEEVMNEKGTMVEIDLTKELKVADEVEVILGDYEFVLKDGRTYFVKKQPEYPTTYTECCILLNHVSLDEVKGYRNHLIENFQILLVCRDAYWKMAGNWKPNFANEDEKFVIAYYYGKITTSIASNYNRVLVFPTKEMRDAFYENFKELIEECKELL